MRLSTRISVITVCIWVLMFLFAYMGFHKILRDSFSTLERNNAMENIDRVRHTMDNVLETLSVLVRDWAFWDDTYYFTDQGNPQYKSFKYIEINLKKESLTTSDFDMLGFFDVQGNVVWGQFFNADRTALNPIPKSVMSEYLYPGSKIAQPNSASELRGYILTENGLYFIASSPILRTNAEGPVKGTTIISKLFSENTLNKMQKITGLDLSISLIQSVKPDLNLDPILTKLQETKEPLLITTEKIILGYVLFRDVNDKPVAILKVDTPRNIYALGIDTIKYINIILAASSIIFTVLLLFLLRTFVTKRLEILNSKIVEISRNSQFFLRLPQKGADELSSVATEINNMLTIIEDSNVKQKQLLNTVKSNEDFLTAIINFMPSIIVITDDNMKITHTNHLAEQSLAAELQNTIRGGYLFDLFPYLKKYEDKIKLALVNKKPEIIERILPDKYNKSYLTAVIYPFSHEQQDTIAFRIDDISERVNLEQKAAQNDKLASIGVLTAGIAHEINNPVNFIASTVTPLKKDLADIFSILDKYSEIKPGSNTEEQLKEIELLKQEIDLAYTLEETNRLLEGIKEGASRTTSIVRDLKTFSRLDENDMKKADLHQGIDSTLSLLQHNYKNRITIVKEYGKIPEIDCYPGKLNQVFMNIISNAIDAIPASGEIRIKTELKGKDNVLISIKDSGVGIKDEVKDKIFEPFFTTKDIGKGTGLGLSICFSIIRSHKGTIEFKSELGKGSEFIIVLPVSISI